VAGEGASPVAEYSAIDVALTPGGKTVSVNGPHSEIRGLPEGREPESARQAQEDRGKIVGTASKCGHDEKKSDERGVIVEEDECLVLAGCIKK
jgi:hypothetical protein